MSLCCDCIKSLVMETVFLWAGQKAPAFQVALLTHSLTAHLNLSVQQRCQKGKPPAGPAC